MLRPVIRPWSGKLCTKGGNHYWLYICVIRILTMGYPIPRLANLFEGACVCGGPQWARAPSFTRFLDHTQRRTTVGRTPLYEWSARRRDLYLTIPNTHNRQTSMPPVEFEPTISAGERPQTYALDRAATGTDIHSSLPAHNTSSICQAKCIGLFKGMFLDASLEAYLYGRLYRC
jgi:hypothetical protein